MRKPSKPKAGGALGNIDEQTGHPGKGTGASTLDPEDNGSENTRGKGSGGSQQDG